MKYRPLLLSLVVAASAFACDDAVTSEGLDFGGGLGRACLGLP